VHMFKTVRAHYGWSGAAFVGAVDREGGWRVDPEAAIRKLEDSGRSGQPICLLGTAFSFVHLLEYLAERKTRFDLPPGSRVMETGGYKGRSRSLAKEELHSQIAEGLGVLPSHIVSEYGMSELSSQAYDRCVPASFAQMDKSSDARPDPGRRAVSPGASRPFQFPPWARVRVVSPETGQEVSEGELGLVRVFDLANVFSVLAIQTEDLGVRRGKVFELIGRAVLAEARGCSLTAV
jgi:acyl-protein synthetase LuxE